MTYKIPTLIASFIALQAAISTAGELHNLPSDYDKQHPYYLKFCPSSQWTPAGKNAGAGVPTGHTVLYVKGACLDRQKGELPSLRLCREGEVDLTSRESGVGISTDGAFKNVVFSGIPGLSPFITGDLRAEDVLDQKKKEELLNRYTDLGYFDGIELNTVRFDKKTKDTYSKLRQAIEEATSDEARAEAVRAHAYFVGDWMFGTEYALGLSRYLYCINIPTSRAVIGQVIDHLNHENSSLAGSKGTPWRGKKKPSDDYLWNGLHNNCDHTGRNAVAAAGFIKAATPDLPLVQQIFNLGLPGHSLLAMMKKMQMGELKADKIFKNAGARKLVMDHGVLPIHHDTLLEKVDFHKNNELFVDTAAPSKSHNPVMGVSIFPTLITQFLPKFKFAVQPLDTKAKIITSAAADPRYSFQPSVGQSERESLLEHYRHFSKKYYQARAEIQKIRATKKFQEMAKFATSQAGYEQIATLQSRLFELERMAEASQSNRSALKKIEAERTQIQGQLKGVQKKFDYVNFINRYDRLLQEAQADIRAKII